MKKNVIIFGLLSGLIVTGMMMYSAIALYHGEHFEPNMVLGYAAMLAAFSFVFIGIRNYRNRYNGGYISFARAFMAGLYITLIASTVYTGVWLIIYYGFMPDFMEKYAAFQMEMAARNGLNAADTAALAQSMDNYKEMYKNPVWVILITYSEVLPVGLFITLLSAFILKRKVPGKGIDDIGN